MPVKLPTIGDVNDFTPSIVALAVLSILLVIAANIVAEKLASLFKEFDISVIKANVLVSAFTNAAIALVFVVIFVVLISACGRTIFILASKWATVAANGKPTQDVFPLPSVFKNCPVVPSTLVYVTAPAVYFPSVFTCVTVEFPNLTVFEVVTFALYPMAVALFKFVYVAVTSVFVPINVLFIPESIFCPDW